jgi:hypothetical protein
MIQNLVKQQDRFANLVVAKLVVVAYTAEAYLASATTAVHRTHHLENHKHPDHASATPYSDTQISCLAASRTAADPHPASHSHSCPEAQSVALAYL